MYDIRNYCPVVEWNLNCGVATGALMNHRAIIGLGNVVC